MTREATAEFFGDDVEAAYAKIFNGEITGGFFDNGKDIKTGDQVVPFIQVKSSIDGAKSFLEESMKRKQFIPIVIGEPGAREEMIESLKKYGGWIGKDESNRQKTLEAISKVRDYCNGLEIVV